MCLFKFHVDLRHEVALPNRLITVKVLPSLRQEKQFTVPISVDWRLEFGYSIPCVQRASPVWNCFTHVKCLRKRASDLCFRRKMKAKNVDFSALRLSNEGIDSGGKLAGSAGIQALRLVLEPMHAI